MAEIAVEQHIGEGREDGENSAVGTFTPKVKELLLAQPLNPFTKVTFQVLPRTVCRQPKAGTSCSS